MLNSIIKVDLAAVEDFLQLGNFENLAIYLTLLLDCLERGARINLWRFPENRFAISYGMITNFEEFANCVKPLLN